MFLVIDLFMNSRNTWIFTYFVRLDLRMGRTKLVREPGTGSRDCSKKSKNEKNWPKIEFFADVYFKNSNFSENLDLLPWVQKSLLLSQIEESTCEREGELKIKFKKKKN
jgi:hypothetical protein